MNTTSAPHAGLLLAATALTFVVFIQPNSLAGNNEKKPPQFLWGKQKPPSPPLQVEQMAQKMDVPFLPEFTGEHKFVSGIMHRSNNGPSCIMTFTSKEDAVRILQWYLSAVKGYGWKVRVQTEDTVSLARDNNVCTISAQRPAVAGERTRYTISAFIYMKPSK